MDFILIRTFDAFFNLLYFLLISRVILSWFTNAKQTRIAGIIYTLTEPMLAPIRYVISRFQSEGASLMFDFSPLIAFILIQIARTAIRSVILA